MRMERGPKSETAFDAALEWRAEPGRVAIRLWAMDTVNGQSKVRIANNGSAMRRVGIPVGTKGIVGCTLLAATRRCCPTRARSSRLTGSGPGAPRDCLSSINMATPAFKSAETDAIALDFVDRSDAKCAIP